MERLCAPTSILRGGGEGGPKSEIGPSRGGLSTKIHALVDKHGNPLRFIITPGQSHESPVAPQILDGMIHEGVSVLGDRGFDSDALIELIVGQGGIAVIPPRSNRKVKREYDRVAYKNRNQVERFFQRLKEFRAIATRYDKTAACFLGGLYLSSIVIITKTIERNNDRLFLHNLESKLKYTA